MTISEMRTMLRSRIGSPSTVDVPDAKLTESINIAYKDIADRYRFHKARKRCQFSTIVGQDKYDLPSDVLAVLRVSDETNRKKLTKGGDRTVSSRQQDATQGRPVWYVRYRDYMQLGPVPDGVYLMEVFYKYALADLTDADNQTPGIPSSWHYGIVLMAKYYYYEDQGDSPKAQTAYEAWKLWVADKPTEIDEETVDIDSGVEIPTLDDTLEPRLDFDHSE
jgi:hypothetical protein